MAKTKRKSAAKPKQATPKSKPKQKPRAQGAAKAKTKAKATPMAKRADFGKPVDGFFAKQPANLRAILDVLRGLVVEVVPDAASSIKWGMPFYTVGGEMFCALGAHKAHVNLILPGTQFDDPDDRLVGEGKTGKHLKLVSVDDIPRDHVRRWLRATAAAARARS